MRKKATLKIDGVTCPVVGGTFGKPIVGAPLVTRETLEAMYGRGSELVEVVLAAQAGHSWGPYDATLDPGRIP